MYTCIYTYNYTDTTSHLTLLCMGAQGKKEHTHWLLTACLSLHNTCRASLGALPLQMTNHTRQSEERPYTFEIFEFLNQIFPKRSRDIPTLPLHCTHHWQIKSLSVSFSLPIYVSLSLSLSLSPNLHVLFLISLPLTHCHLPW